MLMFHILEGINEEKNRNGTNKTFIERVCNVVIPCKKTRYQMVSNSCDMINISLKVKDSTAPCIHCRYLRLALIVNRLVEPLFKI